MHGTLGELVISDTAESLSKKRAGAFKLLTRAARISLLVGVPLSAATDALVFYLRPDASMSQIIIILLVPVIGPLMVIKATFEMYFATTLTLSSEGIKKRILGQTTVICWPRVKHYSVKPEQDIPGLSFLALRFGFGAYISVLIPTERASEVDRFIRRWVHP